MESEMTRKLRGAIERFSANLPHIRKLAEERGDSNFEYFTDVSTLLAATNALAVILETIPTENAVLAWVEEPRVVAGQVIPGSTLAIIDLDDE